MTNNASLELRCLSHWHKHHSLSACGFTINTHTAHFKKMQNMIAQLPFQLIYHDATLNKIWLPFSRVSVYIPGRYRMNIVSCLLLRNIKLQSWCFWRDVAEISLFHLGRNRSIYRHQQLNGTLVNNDCVWYTYMSRHARFFTCMGTVRSAICFSFVDICIEVLPPYTELMV